MSPTLLMEVNPSEILKQGDSIDRMIGILASCGYQFRAGSGVAVPDLDFYCRETHDKSTMIIGEVLY